MTLVLLFIWFTLVYIAAVLPGPLQRQLEKERKSLDCLDEERRAKKLLRSTMEDNLK